MTRIYLALPDPLLYRLKKYEDSLPFQVLRNSLFVKAINEYLKQRGF